ncbi:MAG: histidine phosphatase family protein [Planctomycetes bacterium]|nr:histidine phosphatase family protein [Planctomycetota bacterium]
MTRRLWLVRHGETTGQSRVRYHGRNDVPLADAGRAQIRALAPLLAGVDFVRVVHSPMSRALESAAILADACDLPRSLFVAEERLREISFGDCEGMTAAEIEAAFPDFWRRHQAGTAEAFPGGESRRAFADRVGSVARELMAEDWAGDLLVVGHRGTVRQFLRTLLAVPDGTGDAFAVELGSLTVLGQEDGYHVELLGAVP